MSTTAQPLSTFVSTNLQPKISTYNDLATRISYALGYPMINVEAHINQIYENISIACEMFTKFAGYTEEFLVFDSNLYESGKGINLETLISNTGELNAVYGGPTSTARLSANVASGAINKIAILSGGEGYTTPVLSFSASSQTTEAVISLGVSSKGNSSITGPLTAGGTINSYTIAESGAGYTHWMLSAADFFTITDTSALSAGIDFHMQNKRKVVDVWSFEEGQTTGINTLFTIEQTLAQQTYFSYAMGNYGFDLISWYTLKEWLDTREKMLTTKKYFKFDDRTQYMQIIPQPGNSRYYGLVGAYIEKPLRHIIIEPWVYQYSLALTKITVGTVRGKYTGTSLFGGGSVNAEIRSEGVEEKGKLETQLYEGATPGFGDAAPISFFVG